MTAHSASPIPNQHDWHIEVNPRSAGDFGFARISGIQRSDRDEIGLQQDIMDSIRRHVDGVGAVVLVYDSWLCGVCGDHHESHHGADVCCEEEER